MVDKILNISEATAIAVHTLILLSGKERGLTAVRINNFLKVSYPHLSKVLQMLNKAGIVDSKLGPKGGYSLARPADKIKLIEIWQAIEGRVDTRDCLFKKPICRTDNCPVRHFFRDINNAVKDFFTKTSIADLSCNFEHSGKIEEQKQIKRR